MEGRKVTDEEREYALVFAREVARRVVWNVAGLSATLGALSGAAVAYAVSLF